jgi:hypothetical protein
MVILLFLFLLKASAGWDAATSFANYGGKRSVFVRQDGSIWDEGGNPSTTRLLATNIPDYLVFLGGLITQNPSAFVTRHPKDNIRAKHEWYKNLALKAYQDFQASQVQESALDAAAVIEVLGEEEAPAVAVLATNTEPADQATVSVLFEALDLNERSAQGDSQSNAQNLEAGESQDAQNAASVALEAVRSSNEQVESDSSLMLSASGASDASLVLSASGTLSRAAAAARLREMLAARRASRESTGSS